MVSETATSASIGFADDTAVIPSPQPTNTFVSTRPSGSRNHLGGDIEPPAEVDNCTTKQTSLYASSCGKQIVRRTTRGQRGGDAMRVHKLPETVVGCKACWMR